MAWTTGYPVKFTSDGDYTHQAIEKHINELVKVYGHLCALRNFSVSVNPPADADLYDTWLDPSTMELKTYFGEGQGWMCVLRVQNAVTSQQARGSDSSLNSDKLGGYPASYYATLAGLRNLETLVEESLAEPIDASKVLVFKGAWQDGGGYDPYDVVEYQGSSYVLMDGDGLVPPPDPAYWQVLASAGKDFFMSILDGGRPDTEYAVFVSGGTP